MFDIGEVHRGGYGRVKRRPRRRARGARARRSCSSAIPVVAVANLVGNRGPLFYRQPRVGKTGRVFTIFKFRTMRAVAGGDATWTAEDDPRITPFGRRAARRPTSTSCRRCCNILRGDLSVVGPRPEQPHYVDELATKLPFYDLRHLVRPGLTGGRR